MGFTHFNDQGQAHMVNVSDKDITSRKAVARGRIYMNKEVISHINSGTMKKGDVLGVAQVAGVMGAKKTSDLIPMCHPLPLTGVDLVLNVNTEELCVEIEATAETIGRTGVEMEALSAVSTAALTIYDMCKAVDKSMVIKDICLVHKSGGKSGDFNRED